MMIVYEISLFVFRFVDKTREFFVRIVSILRQKFAMWSIVIFVSNFQLSRYKLFYMINKLNTNSIRFRSYDIGCD